MREGLRAKGSKIPESELQRIMDNADVNGKSSTALQAAVLWLLASAGSGAAGAVLLLGPVLLNSIIAQQCLLTLLRTLCNVLEEDCQLRDGAQGKAN